MRQSLRQFVYGVLFGVILFPILYIGRLWWRHRTEEAPFDDTEWP